MITPHRPYLSAFPNYSPCCATLLWSAIISFIIFFPFVVCDLYYAYEDQSCVQIHTNAGNIDLNLKTWFQVDGYVILVFLILFLFIGVLTIPYNDRNCFYILWENVYIIFILWRLSWLIVGSVVFWADINKRGVCNKSVGRYMWADLIIGFVWLFVSLILAFTYVRPITQTIPVPVTLPVSPTPTGQLFVVKTKTPTNSLRPMIF